MAVDRLQVSPVFEWNYNCRKPVVVNQGGSSSGKTYSILQVLFLRNINEPGTVTTVVGQDIPNLKKGALRDAETIVASSPAIQSQIVSYNKSDRIYTFKNKSVIEFTSYQDAQDAKSGKRDYLFLNEANGISKAVYDQLAIRTKRQVFIDYNPSEEFWVHESVIPNPDTQLFISNYTHNPFLPQSIVRKIEALQFDDPELWKVYGRGLTGKIEGLIYRNYHIIPEGKGIPLDATFLAAGLDFGFTNDPTAIVMMYKQNGELWLDEVVYETGLTNPDIVTRLRNESVRPGAEIIADSAEPKSIQEIANLGYANIQAAQKGPDSVRNGINTLKKYTMNITARSTGLRKELKSYKWKVNKDGKSLNEPVDFQNHALDCIRYVALNKLGHNENSGSFEIW